MFDDLHPLFRPPYSGNIPENEASRMCYTHSTKIAPQQQQQPLSSLSVGAAAAIKLCYGNHITCLHSNTVFEIKIALWTVRCFWGFTFLFRSLFALFSFFFSSSLFFVPLVRFSRGKSEYISPMPYSSRDQHHFCCFCPIFILIFVSFFFCFISSFAYIYAHRPYFSPFIVNASCTSFCCRFLFVYNIHTMFLFSPNVFRELFFMTSKFFK